MISVGVSTESERDLIIEALYKAEDLAESGKAFDPEIMEELRRRITGLTEANFENQLHDHLQVLGKVRDKLENDGKIEDAFVIAATGTGILLYLQKTMRLARMAKQTNLDMNLKEKLEALNSLRIRRVVGTENDQISHAIQEILQ